VSNVVGVLAIVFACAEKDMEPSVKSLIPLVRHQLLAKYFNVASAVILIFDTLENFGDEVDLIWRQRLTVGKALYLASRYMAFIDVSLMLLYLFDSHLEPKICHRLYVTTTYFTLVGACTAELVLLIRIYAIWKQSMRILAFLTFISLTLFVTSILNLNIHNNIKTLIFLPSPVPIIIPCFLPKAQIRAFVDFGCLVVMDLTILVLTTWGCFKIWKENASSPLIVTFYRDGVLYFICLFAVSLANVVVFILGDPEQQGILVELQRVLHSVLSARIILNLRKFVVVTGVDEGPKDLTTAIFGELVSDPLSSTAYTTTTQRTQEPEEEGIELQDLRPPTRASAELQNIGFNSGGEGSHSNQRLGV